MVLNENNKNIYINYCTRLCMIGLKDNGIEIEKVLEEYVTEEINNNIKKDYGGSRLLIVLAKNVLMKKYKVGLINIEEKLILAKSGNEYFLRSLIEYYQIIFEFNINIKNEIEPIENKEKILQEGRLLIDSSIKTYVHDDSNKNFFAYILNVLDKFNYQNKIKTSSKEKNIIIDIKNGDFKNKDYLYNLYYNLMKKTVLNNTLIPEDKFNRFLYVYTKEKIDDYFSNESLKSTLRNYMRHFTIKLASYSDEFMLIKYNLYFDDYYDESLDFFTKAGNEMVCELLSEKSISNAAIKCKLINDVNEDCKKYLDLCIYKAKIISIKGIIEKNVKSNLKLYLKQENKFQTDFDFELAKYGSPDDKKEQEAILLRDLRFLIERAENKFIYYTFYENVRQKVENSYEKNIHAYVYRIIERLNPNNSLSKPEVYISMRLLDDMKRFYRKTKRVFIGSAKVCQFEAMCDPIIKDFISKQPECFDVDTFNIYVKNAIKNYIDAGSYKENIRIYIAKIIYTYNYDFAKQLDEILFYEQSEVKVLRRPLIK